MTPVRRGGRISKVEVTNVSRQGFRLLLEDRELFVPFAGFPWFRDASIGQILDVERPGAGHLYWPQLDVDLAVESIEHPERYPIVSRAPRRMPARPTEAVTVRESKPAYPSPRRHRLR
jgi:hypothetical protein